MSAVFRIKTAEEKGKFLKLQLLRETNAGKRSFAMIC